MYFRLITQEFDKLNDAALSSFNCTLFEISRSSRIGTGGKVDVPNIAREQLYQDQTYFTTFHV